jgi:hypothetical protein
MTTERPSIPGTETPAESGEIDVFGTCFALLKRLEDDPEFNAVARRIWNETERELETTGRAMVELLADEERRESFWEGVLGLLTKGDEE